MKPVSFVLAALAALVLQGCAGAPGRTEEKSILDVIDESQAARRTVPVNLCPSGTVAYCMSEGKCACVTEEDARSWLRNTFGRP